MNELVTISVAVEDTHVDRVSEVAAALAANGMTIDQILETVGVITGDAPEDSLDDLRAVAGVKAVEHVRDVSVP